MTDLSEMTYGELVAALRKDLQLDLSTDALPKTLPQSSLAPQRYAIVQSANDALANNAGTVLSAWSVFSSTQYAKASTAGIKTLLPGMYLMILSLRWTISVGEFFAGITINASLYGNDFFSGGAVAADGYGAHQAGLLLATGGELISAQTFQTSGAPHLMQNSHILAYYLGPLS